MDIVAILKQYGLDSATLVVLVFVARLFLARLTRIEDRLGLVEKDSAVHDALIDHMTPIPGIAAGRRNGKE